MNQADYKAIAKILKLDELDIHKIIQAKHPTKETAYYEGMNRAIQNTRSQLIQLADYFERQAHTVITEEGTEYRPDIQNPDVFDRKQFLKACGVVK